MSVPATAACLSVVGTPSESSAHPGGISGAGSAAALTILFFETAVVAMSSSQAPSPVLGMETQMGLVPILPSRPCQGATDADALHSTTPIMPASDKRCAQNAAAPKWLELRAITRPTP